MTDKINSMDKNEQSINLNLKTKPELLDLLKRQEALLANKRFLQRLPDKGEKVRQLKQSIEEAIVRLNSIADVTRLVERLNIKAENDDTVEQEPDVFKTLATNTCVPRKVVTALVISSTSVDAQHERQDHAESFSDHPFIERLTMHLEQKQKLNSHRQRLLFNRTKASPGKQESDANKSIRSRIWMETAVTPPPAIFKEAKIISLQESYQLQTEQSQRQKEVHIERAAQHLIERMNLDNFETESIEDTNLTMEETSDHYLDEEN